MDASSTPSVPAPVTPPANAAAPAATPVIPITAPIVDPATLAKQKHASWGAIIVILLILGMVVVGAFYAWGKRIAQTQQTQTTQQ